tara:strand:+ start:52 stop:237 length:186 start_codon:yes stop_codon:yes gene_type:complete
MKKHLQKARLQHIAKHAGIGLSTVDKALNERGNNFNNTNIVSKKAANLFSLFYMFGWGGRI